jgi:hypothetical protein
VEPDSSGYREQARRDQACVGVAWFTREQWALVRAAAVDPERLRSTYERWLTMAEDGLAKLSAAGCQAETVHLEANELVLWCESESRQLDSAARAGFAAHKLRLLRGEAL